MNLKGGFTLFFFCLFVRHEAIIRCSWIKASKNLLKRVQAYSMALSVAYTGMENDEFISYMFFEIYHK